MLVDTNKRDTSWNIWGHKTSAPIGFSPIGINKIYHPLGELPVAKVAKELNLPYCLSTAGSQPIEDVAASNGEGTRFFQLYMPHDDELTISLLRRAVDSGYTACILTVEYVFSSFPYKHIYVGRSITVTIHWPGLLWGPKADFVSQHLAARLETRRCRHQQLRLLPRPRRRPRPERPCLQEETR